MVLGNSFTTVLFLGGSRNNRHLAVSTKLNIFNPCQILVSFISGLLVIYSGTINLEQVSVSTYIIPSAPGGEVKIICINLVLPMG